MVESALDALPALATPEGNLWDRRIGDIVLHSIAARRITTFACAPDSADALGAALQLAPPATGHSTIDDRARRLLGLQADQWWLIEDDDGADDTRAHGSGRLPDATGVAWRTEQSDGWASLAVAGGGSLAVLERLVPLDLARFEHGQVARTMIEHIAAIVLRTDTERFELLTPRSSVRSFAHALETVAAQVAADSALHDPVAPEN